MIIISIADIISPEKQRADLEDERCADPGDDALEQYGKESQRARMEFAADRRDCGNAGSVKQSENKETERREGREDRAEHLGCRVSDQNAESSDDRLFRGKSRN